MDFLSRLIAGSGHSPSKASKANTPAERLATCKRVCLALQQIWRNGSSLSEDETAKAHVKAYIKRLNTVLHDESRKTAPHSCMQYATSTQIYIIVTKVSISAEDAEVVVAAAQFFHILINGETESVLDSKIFARSLIDLVRKSRGIDEKGHADLIELLFEICAKIRVDPDILPAWFYPERGLRVSSKQDAAQGSDLPDIEVNRLEQFPLFYLLVDHVHDDGSSGDFARTGLLYLIEAASTSQSLEKWMIESDLAPQMASGLGALYSRLSRSLSVSPTKKLPPIVALSHSRKVDGHNDDAAEEDSEKNEAESEEVHSEASENVKAFLSYLAFWQDTLNHCSSPEVSDTLLDHFQVLFVQQLLYPSLLESSDLDGGSTASVIAHLYRILDSLERRDLVERIVTYLLASHDQRIISAEKRKRRPRMSVSRRKSMDKLAAMAEIQDAPSPDLFNLLDLLTLSLRSQRPETTTAALKLISIMIRKHHDQVSNSLFRTQYSVATTITIDALNNELMQLLRFATSITNAASIENSYQTILLDTRIMISEHICKLKANINSLESEAGQQTLDIARDCKLMKALSTLCETFFSNETMINLSLTESIISMASCNAFSLHGWLLDSAPAAASPELSVISILERQIGQIQQWRKQFPLWNNLIAMQQSRLLGEHVTTPAIRPISRGSSDRPMSPRAISSPNPMDTKPMIGSPLRQSYITEETEKTLTAAEFSNMIQTQIELPKSQEPAPLPSSLSSIADRLSLQPQSMTSNTPSELSSGFATPSLQEVNDRTVVSLGHILTNCIILQEFLLEIAALVQIRASMFDEVDVG